MKKKASGKFRARTNARGHEQVDGVHFFSTDTSSPTVNDVSIKIIFALLLMATLDAHLLDACGAFILGYCENGERIFM